MAYSDSQEITLALPALSSIFLDSATGGSIALGKKVIVLVVTTPLTWVTSGQAKWQPFTSRNAFTAAGGAATTLGTTQALLGAQQNLGAAAVTTLPNGMYFIDPTGVPALQWPYPSVGVEFQFPSALTGGACALYLETGP